AAHSWTEMGTQRSGADPSYLPAAAAANGPTQMPAPASTRATRAVIFILSLQSRIRSITGDSHADRVSAARHAHAEGAVVVRASLRHDPLLLGLVGLLRLLLFLRPAGPTHEAEQAAHPGPDGGALACVAPDSATHRTQGCAARGAPEHPALWSSRRGR